MNNMTPTKRLNILLILGFVLLAAIIAGGIYLVNRQTSAPKGISENQQVTTDKTSGVETTNTVGKDAETVGQNPNAPLLLGFAQLLSLGVTEDDTKAIKQFATDYALSNMAIPAKSKISFDKKAFTQQINSDFTTDYHFAIVINDKTRYTVNAHTDSISAITMNLVDDKGVTVYSKN